MSILAAITIFAVIWVMVFTAVLSWTSPSFRLAGGAIPLAVDPDAPKADLKPVFIRTSWIALIVFALFWLAVQFKMLSLQGMGPLTAVSIYLVIWWTVFMGVLPLGNRTFHEAGIAPPPGCDPGAPINPNMKKKVVTTSWVSAVVFVAFWLIVDLHLITLPGVAQVY